MKKMRFGESLFILPALILIVIFSLWPILRAFTYTFFDYRLNDQQKSHLYLSPRYNVELFSENADYIILFMNGDKKSAPEESHKKIEEVISETEYLKELLKEQTGFIKLSGDLEEKVREKTKSIISKTNYLVSNYNLKRGENLKQITEGLNKCFVEPNFIGLKGYNNAFKDRRISDALKHTLIFTIISVFLEFILGLGLAIIMNNAIRGRGFIRTTSLIPWAIPTAVAALMWGYLYDGSNGIVAHLFQYFHIIEDSRNLLLTAGGGMTSIILADVWKTTPYMALLILAGFQTIPKALYESAAIDGSNTIHTFFKITLPLLKPAILVALLFRTLDAFRVFDLVYVLTGGGPGGSTETLSIYSYKLMFEQTNFGYGSIVVIFMFVCVAIIATIFVKILGTNLMEKN